MHTYTLAQVRAYLAATSRARAANLRQQALIARSVWADQSDFSKFLKDIERSGR